MVRGATQYESYGLKPEESDGADLMSGMRRQAQHRRRVSPREEVLGSVKLEFNWGTTAGGSIMVANFTIRNPTKYSIKEIEITCRHSAPSGTEIDSNRRTIYESIKANSSRTFKNFNMGFIHDQATRSRCEITDFGLD